MLPCIVMLRDYFLVSSNFSNTSKWVCCRSSVIGLFDFNRLRYITNIGVVGLINHTTLLPRTSLMFRIIVVIPFYFASQYDTKIPFDSSFKRGFMWFKRVNQNVYQPCWMKKAVTSDFFENTAWTKSRWAFRCNSQRNLSLISGSTRLSNICISPEKVWYWSCLELTKIRHLQKNTIPMLQRNFTHSSAFPCKLYLLSNARPTQSYFTNNVCTAITFCYLPRDTALAITSP